jgi:hypothetical protein
MVEPQPSNRLHIENSRPLNAQVSTDFLTVMRSLNRKKSISCLIRAYKCAYPVHP